MYPVREDLVEKYGESYGANVESMVGCGPFKMTSWKRNSKIELEKNENYWDKDSVKLDKVNYQIVSDQTVDLWIMLHVLIKSGSEDLIRKTKLMLLKHQSRQ